MVTGQWIDADEWLTLVEQRHGPVLEGEPRPLTLTGAAKLAELTGHDHEPQSNGTTRIWVEPNLVGGAMLFGTAASTGMVESAEFLRHGYAAHARLAIQPARGRYVVTLYPLAMGGAIGEVIECRPETEAQQAAALDLAMTRPVDAILEVIRIAEARRRDGY